MVSINLKNKRAALFDMDGTMLDNVPAHREAWKKFCQKHNINFSSKLFDEKISGKKNSEILYDLFGEAINSGLYDSYAEEKESIYRDIYRNSVKEIVGLTKKLSELKSLGLKLAICTTAPEENRKLALSSLRLDDFFDLILGSENIHRGKPDPEIYLKASELLGIDPSDCVVFEDTPAGVKAGKSAAMTVVGIMSNHNSDDLSLADYLVDNYNELDLI